MFLEDDIAKDRLKICKSCEHLTKLNVCSKCYCFIPAKIKIAKSQCPLKKWTNPWVSW